ncbi:MAG TPA: ABC transporter ATP-binding protein, partial [Roseiarcus sp.]|nr:ABC transporter ATP-binding protein [Roseiarcus sp.]
MRVRELETPAPDPILDVLNIEVVYNSVALALKGVSLSAPKGGI